MKRFRVFRTFAPFTFALLAALFSVTPAAALDVELLAVIGKEKGSGPGQFRYPTDVVVDREGNIHVADSGNGRIQVFTADGSVVREYGKANVREPLKEPYGIAAGPDGNLYVADRGLGKILVFSPNGAQQAVISDSGSKPGLISKPQGIAVDSQGRIYVADTGNDRVSVFSPEGIFLYALDAGWDPKANFEDVVDVAVDAADQLYVADKGQERVVIFNTGGAIENQVAGRAAGFARPEAIAVDRSGALAVLDGKDQRVIHLGPDRQRFLPFGTSGSQPGQFDEAHGLLFDDARDLFIVADSDNNRVQIFKVRTRKLDKPLAAAAPRMMIRHVRDLKVPATDIAVGDDSGLLFAAVPDEKKVSVVDEAGAPKFDIPATGDSFGELRRPRAVHFIDGLLYVADHSYGTFKVFNDKGVFQFKFGESGSKPGEFDEPRGMDFHKGDVYVADTDNDRVQVLTGRGVFRKEIKGSGSNALDNPWDLAVDPDGSVYAADTGRNQLRKFTNTGAPAWARGGRGYGRTLFEEPRAVARDDDGYLYVLDKNGVQIFDTDGLFVSRFGAGGLSGPGNFQEPTCLTLDARRGARLYICDPKQGVVQVVDVQRVPTAPKNLKLEASQSYSTLSWEAPEERFRRGFVLYVAESAEGPWHEVAAAEASPLKIEYPLAKSGTYFRLAARSHAGIESPPSDLLQDRFARGRLAFQAGRYDDALAAFDEQLLADPKHAPSLLYKGMTLGKLERFDEATNALTDLSMLEGWQVEAFLALSRVFLAAEKVQAADDNLRRVLATEQGEKNADAWLLYAEVAIRKGLYEDAIERANKALQIDPERVEAYMALGDAYMAKKLYDDARKAYVEAGKRDPRNVDVYTKLAGAYLGAGDKETAVKALNKAAELEPENAALQVQIAQVYYDAGDRQSARGRLREAQKLAPELAAIDELMGRIAFDEGSYPTALESFERAARKEPNNLDVQLLLGLALQKLGRKDEARSAFQKVLSLTPATLTAQLKLGKTLMDYDLYDLALDTFDKISQIEPANADAPRYAGEAYFRLKRYPNAINKLEQAARANPNDASTHYLLGLVYRESKVFDKAVARLKLATFISPRTPQYFGALGQAYLDTGANQRAVDALKVARELDPRNDAYVNLYKQARSKADRIAQAGGGPLEVVEVNFKTVAQSQFAELSEGGICTVFLRNKHTKHTVHQVKVSMLAEGFMNFPAEERMATIGPAQVRSVELKGKFNQAAYDLTQDVVTLAEFRIEYYYNKELHRETLYEPFLIRADAHGSAK